jgi:DNA-binding transcriptional regulator YhcF (GntR family)
MSNIDNKIENHQKFEDGEYLRYGDLRAIAKDLGVHPGSVYRVYQGTAKSDWIELAIKNTIKVRKEQVLQVGVNVKSIN